MLIQTLKSIFRKTETQPVAPLDKQVRTLVREGRMDEACTLLHEGSRLPDVAEEERLALLGEVHYHRNEREEAETCFQAALRLRPSQAEGHYGLSLLYYDSGRFEDALAHAQFARNVRPDSAPILAQTGLCYIAAKDYSNARDVLRQATLLDPDNVPALNNLGISLHATGDPESALYYFRRALELKPGYAPALTNLRNLFGFEAPALDFDAETGSALTHLDGSQHGPVTPSDQDAADIERLESNINANPNDMDSVGRLLELYLKALRLEDARDVLHVALASHPDNVALLTQSGRIAHMLGQLNQAVANFQLALDQEPDNVEALLGLSQVQRDLGRMEDALSLVERAAAADDSIATRMQLAAAQANACRYEACLVTCNAIEEREPGLAPYLLTNKAVSNAFLGHFDVAVAYADRLQEFEPGNIGLQCFLGILNLQHERYEEGWTGYRYRFLMAANDQRILPFPRWQGEDLVDKTVLVLAEQGLGDQVMFASCLPDLLACKPRQVLLEAHIRVAKTLERSFPDVRVIHSGQSKFLDWYDTDLEPDYYVHIADLPYFFRRSSSAFPVHSGYLVADPARIEYWRTRLRQANGLPKVGISWRGGLQKTRQRIRSLDLHRLQSLISLPSLQFVNLQYGEVEDELTGFQADTGLNVLHFPEAINDLDEFAALVEALDLVVSVCNTTVHYAGALGKTCWVLTPYIPEWRYGLSAPSMRWYPSTRMFRQPVMDDWNSVLQAVHRAIEAWPGEAPT